MPPLNFIFNLIFYILKIEYFLNTNMNKKIFIYENIIKSMWKGSKKLGKLNGDKVLDIGCKTWR